MFITSVLSDIQEPGARPPSKEIMNFVKFLVMKYCTNRINLDDEKSEFKEKFGKRLGLESIQESMKKVSLTELEKLKVKKFALKLVESRKKPLTEGFKRDALEAISECEDVYKELQELGLSDEALEKLEEFIQKKVHIYDDENLEFAIEAFLYSDWDEDDMLNDMENVANKVEARHGTERDMTNQCLNDVANAINQFIKASKGK